jgi:hypothetical protein
MRIMTEAQETELTIQVTVPKIGEPLECLAATQAISSEMDS